MFEVIVLLDRGFDEFRKLHVSLYAFPSGLYCFGFCLHVYVLFVFAIVFLVHCAHIF